MLIYEKDGKLILNFQAGTIPQEVNDVEMYKEDNTVHVFLGDNDLGDTTKILSSISVKGFKTTYSVGDKIDLSGTTVTAKYDDGSTEVVTTYTTTPDADTALSAENTSVIFSYTENDVTKTVTKSITVS